MIKVDLNKVEVEGPRTVVMSEFTLLASELRKVLSKKFGEEAADKEILHCIELSKMTEDEVDAETEKLERELIRRLLFGGDLNV